MVFMELQVLYHIKISNCLVVIFCSICIACNEKKQINNYSYICYDTAKIETSNGVVIRNGTPFSGILFKLNNGFDTVFSLCYQNGLKESRSVLYHSTGSLSEERYYSTGKKIGTAIGYWPSGTLKFTYHYKNDLYDGVQEEWFQNGKCYSRKNFNNGYENGMQQCWDSTGLLLANYEARNGRNYGIIGKKHCKSN